MANRDVTVRLRAEIGNFEAAMKRAANATQEVATSGQGAFDRLAQKQREHEQAWSTLSTGAVVAGGAMVAAVGSVVAKYASFDKAMSAVQASTHASGVEMEKLRELAIRAGADTAYSGEEAAAGINELAKAGVSTNDILRGGLTGALSLAAAGEIEVGDAAELAATAMTQFNLEGKDLGHVADLLAAGAGKAQGSVGDLGYALKQSGLVASQAGISIEETVGTLAAFASAGLVGSDAGTSFKTMLQKLQNPSDKAAQTLSELGVSMYDSQGNFVGMVELADQLRAGMENLTPAQRDAAMATIFGSDAVRAANVLYAQGGAGIQDWINKVNDAGYAAETAAALQDNLAGDLEKLGGAFDTVALQAGGSLNDALRILVQGLTDVVEFVGQIPGPVLTAGAAIVGLGGAGLLTVGGLMKGVSAVAEFKDAADALGLSLPKLDGKLGSLTKTAGAFAVGLTASMTIVGAAGRHFEQSSIGADRMAKALGNSDTALDHLNQQFKNAEWANANGNWFNGTVHGVNGVADAIVNLQGLGFGQDISNWIASTLGFEDATMKMIGDLEALDASLAGMPLGESSALFAELAQQVEASGGSVEEMANTFPQLKNAVTDYAASLGVTLTEQETLQAMMGELPPKLVEAQAAAEGAGTGMGDLGGAMGELAGTAGETAMSLEDVISALQVLGELHISETQAMQEFNNSLVEVQTQLAATGAGLDATGTRFDTHTDAGQRANDMVINLAQQMWTLTEAQAANGASNEVLVGTMQSSYDAMVNSMVQMGLTRDQADLLTRSVLGVPPNVDIDTWMSDAAQRMAESTKGAVDAVPDSHHTDSSMSSSARTEAEATQGALSRIERNIQISINTVRTETVLGRVAAPAADGSKGRGFGVLKYTGGFPTQGAFPIRGFANGGLLPGMPPSNPYLDNLAGMVVDTGEPVMLRSREFIVNEPGVWRGANLEWLRWMNAGGTMHAPPRGFAVGGSPVAAAATRSSGALAPGIGEVNITIPQVDSDPTRLAVRVRENMARELSKLGGV